MNWCFDCGSALAEAEVEYEDKNDIRRSTSAFRSPSRHKLAQRVRPGALPDDKPGFAVIWTTTPWTIPANQALNVASRTIVYDLVADRRAGC